MPGVGGLSIANNLLANSIQLNLNKNQESLKKLTAQLSSGLSINTAADDPSGYAIAVNLQTQVDGFDQASKNVQDATNLATVANGGLTTITDILSRIRTLAIEGASSILSASDRGNIQTEITQLVAEVNNIAKNTQFNGLNLLDGSNSGYQAADTATATITQNSALNSSNSNLIASATVLATGAAVDGTFELQVVQGATTQSTIVSYITSGGLGGAIVGTVNNGAGATVFFYTTGSVTISLSGVGTADIGSTAFVKILSYVTATNVATTPAFVVHSEANEGDIISVGIQSVTASALRVSNVNVQSAAAGFSTLASEDTIGQIDNALQTVLTLQANIGAVEVRLSEESDNNNLASVNLQASESSIRDLNVAQASTEYTKAQLLTQFGTSLLAQANTNAQSVLTLFR